MASTVRDEPHHILVHEAGKIGKLQQWGIKSRSFKRLQLLTCLWYEILHHRRVWQCKIGPSRSELGQRPRQGTVLLKKLLARWDYIIVDLHVILCHDKFAQGHCLGASLNTWKISNLISNFFEIGWSMAPLQKSNFCRLLLPLLTLFQFDFMRA